LPTGETHWSIKAGEDTSGDEAGECLGKDKTGVEQSNTQSKLASGVPAGHEEDSSREQRSLNDAKNELESPETFCICASKGGGGDTRPEERSNR
jgi:hypothetical protein